ncbi:MAG: ABC transporter ATP-binding protein [Proteobacteria bacterium]|nr:ABC transporter ATP-binding protein [Pseudomonadota bacterium]
MENTACLDLQGVTKTFGGLHAISGVDLNLAVGERRAIIGPNGAGKTTLFNLICGELFPSEGAILLFGQDVTKLPVHKRISLGISRTYQVTNLFPELTVLENLLLAAQGTNRAKFVMFRPMSFYREFYERAETILDEFNLQVQRDTQVKNLSHGEQRQVEVCLALIGQPRLLLLDEPTAGLSNAETQSFTATLKKIDPQITVLLIEHDMDVAFELADSITVLHLGELVISGKAEDIKNNKTVQEIYFGTEV